MQPQPSRSRKSLAGVEVLGTGASVSSPRGHQHSPRKAQTSWSLQTQVFDGDVTQADIPHKKSCL